MRNWGKVGGCRPSLCKGRSATGARGTGQPWGAGQPTLRVSAFGRAPEAVERLPGAPGWGWGHKLSSPAHSLRVCLRDRGCGRCQDSGPGEQRPHLRSEGCSEGGQLPGPQVSGNVASRVSLPRARPDAWAVFHHQPGSCLCSPLTQSPVATATKPACFPSVTESQHPLPPCPRAPHAPGRRGPVAALCLPGWGVVSGLPGPLTMGAKERGGWLSGWAST